MDGKFLDFLQDSWFIAANFTRCKYRNKEGFYGTRGKCVQGTEVAPRTKVPRERMASPDLPLGAQAVLLTLQELEGTDKSDKPYMVMFGGKTFKNNFKDHPRRLQDWSDAAGAYQFLSTTWDDFSKATGIKKFTPRNQDKAALWLIKGRLSDGEYADLMGGKLTPGMIHKLSKEWASMPYSDGKSYYGQPSKSEEEILKSYRNNLLRLGA